MAFVRKHPGALVAVALLTVFGALAALTSAHPTPRPTSTIHGTSDRSSR